MSRKLKTSNSLVSVVTPAYNAERYISETIQSVLGQDTDLEYVIVDDGSTDRTEEIVRSYQDPRIVYIKQKNQGPSVARNRAFKAAKGRYVINLDADDLFCDGALVHKSSLLDRNPEIDVAVGNVQYVNDDGTLTAFAERNEYLRGLSVVNLLVHLIRAPNFPDNQLMWRKKAFLKIGGYFNVLYIDEDIEILITALQQGIRFGFVEPFTGLYRLSRNSLTRGGDYSVKTRRIHLKQWPRSPQGVADILFADDMTPNVSDEIFTNVCDPRQVAVLAKTANSQTTVKSVLQIGGAVSHLVQMCLQDLQVAAIIKAMKKKGVASEDTRLALYDLFTKGIIDLKQVSLRTSASMGMFLARAQK